MYAVVHPEAEEAPRTVNPQDEIRNSESHLEQWNTAWILLASPLMHLCKIRSRKMQAFNSCKSVNVSSVLPVVTVVALHFLQIDRTLQPHLSSAPLPAQKMSEICGVSLPGITCCAADGSHLLSAGNQPIHLPCFCCYVYKIKALPRQVDHKNAHIQHNQNCLLWSQCFCF